MKKILILFIIALLINSTIAQTISPQVISSAGDNYNNSTYQLDWSIGEVLTETYFKNQIFVSQGFQQGNFVISNISENKLSNIEIIVFPNPTSNYVTIEITENDFVSNNLEFIITDINGKIIQTGKFTSQIYQIDFFEFSVGTYFINIVHNNQSIKLLKVIKT